MEAGQLRRSPNPNICASCEQLLEDDSPAFMAEMARMAPDENNTDDLLDQPMKPSETTPTPAEPAPSEPKSSKK